MGLPESAVVGTHNDPISFRRRLTRYRAVNVLDGPDNPVGFFEEGIKLEVLEVALGADADLPATVSDVLLPYIERKGGVYNYHPTEEEVAAEEARVKSAEVGGWTHPCDPWAQLQREGERGGNWWAFCSVPSSV